jgi:hypothetical protein
VTRDGCDKERVIFGDRPVVQGLRKELRVLSPPWTRQMVDF